MRTQLNAIAVIVGFSSIGTSAVQVQAAPNATRYYATDDIHPESFLIRPDGTYMYTKGGDDPVSGLYDKSPGRIVFHVARGSDYGGVYSASTIKIPEGAGYKVYTYRGGPPTVPTAYVGVWKSGEDVVALHKDFTYYLSVKTGRSSPIVERGRFDIRHFQKSIFINLYASSCIYWGGIDYTPAYKTQPGQFRMILQNFPQPVPTMYFRKDDPPGKNAAKAAATANTPSATRP